MNDGFSVLLHQCTCKYHFCGRRKKLGKEEKKERKIMLVPFVFFHFL